MNSMNAACLFVLSVFIAPRAVTAGEKPIVAVFGIEERGAGLSRGLVDRLSDYLATSLTQTGSYQVVPREEIKKRLLQQKKKSHKMCYDRSCQLELGKELAAEKSLATQILKLGSKCTVTATLYDLKKSATEGAAKVHGLCGEDDIVKSLDSAIDQLVSGNREAASTAGVATETPEVTESQPSRDLATIDFVSKPEGAEVFLDGTARGKTPLRLELQVGDTHDLRLELEGYQTTSQQVSIEDREQLDFDLEISEEEIQRIRFSTEWIAVDPTGGFGTHGEFYLGALLRFFTLKWKHLYVTVLEGGFQMADARTWSVGSRASYPIMLTEDYRHQVLVGAGLGIWSLRISNRTSENYFMEKTSLYLSPNIRYSFHVTKRFSIGLDVRFFASIAELSTGDNTDDDYAWALFFSVPIAWSW